MAHPPVDRHTHLEGSLDPRWVRGVAERRQLVIPPALDALWHGERVAFEIPIATAHQTTGAVILALTTLLFAWERRLLTPAPASDAPPQAT